MTAPHYRIPSSDSKAGQVLVLFLLFAVVLLLFVGLGIDLGFAYITKARLSKALDAASLAAISNYSGADNPPGKNAVTLAQNTFWANYGTNGVTGLSGGVQVQSQGHFALDAATGNLTFTNTASATINTFFIGLLPQWKTLTVGDTAVASRAPVAMTLVVDRTGSMTPNGALGPCSPNTQGGKYLPGAVTQFINIFDETLDRAALVSFSVSSSNDVPMTAKNGLFKTPIINTLNRFNNLWAGGTCSIAGLTNALVIQKNLVVTPNVVKVVVFFTDGRANMTEGVFNGIPLNFGGEDPLQPGCPFTPQGASFWRTNTAESANPPSVCSINGCLNAAPNCNAGTTVGSTWTNVHGVANNFCPLYITEDATNRCVLLANQMRANSNYVYAVGLTAPGALAPPTLETLQQMANDPASPQFDPTLPVGAAFLSNGQDLSEVFQQVAADIILRLVR
jgi:Flp pilus assembly protein TadG